MSDYHPSRGVLALGLFVKGLVRYGWFALVGLLLIAWLLDWASWQKLLALGIAGALAIAASPMVYGAALALDSRRQAQAKARG